MQGIATVGRTRPFQAAQPGLAGVLSSLAEMLIAWIARTHQRRDLIGLDERMLRDVGLTRADAQWEYSKPVWRA